MPIIKNYIAKFKTLKLKKLKQLNNKKEKNYKIPMI